MDTITFITGNKGKLREVREILIGSNLKIESRSIDLMEIQGNSHEIASAKCNLASEIINGPVLIEDTSLSFNALNGMPGPYIKWFMDSMGLSTYKLLDSFEDKTAKAITIFAFSEGPGHPILLFEGISDGKIVPPRTNSSIVTFGWDPIFEPVGYTQTYAEICPDIKHTISHRSIALHNFRNYIIKNPITIKEN
jgi:inosine triphosphate pyrophosphatase